MAALLKELRNFMRTGFYRMETPLRILEIRAAVNSTKGLRWLLTSYRKFNCGECG